MRFRVAWVALGFFVVACSDRGVKRELEDWRATPEVLTFDGAIVGVRVRAELTLNNLSRAPVSVSLAVNEPFTVEAETIELAGGQERVLWVSLVAPAPGPLKGTLQVRSLDTEQTIALVADVQPPSPCLPRGPCEQVVIEPSTQACIRSVQADGTSCATACLENGVCSAGECKGTAKNCDDGNACTLDACDVLSGCTHDGAVNCPKSTNPCQVPFCDSKTGCGQTDAADGTRCGADELILLQNQHVLGLAGQDLTELTPEGKVQYQCRLNTTTRGRASLHAGQLVIFDSTARQISSYSILDRDLAPKGWVTQWGGKNMRGSRPR